MRSSPSVVESMHGWRTAMHLQGRNEVENRNGACVMEVASLGSRAKIGAEGRGEDRKKASLGGMERSGMQASCDPFPRNGLRVRDWGLRPLRSLITWNSVQV